MMMILYCVMFIMYDIDNVADAFVISKIIVVMLCHADYVASLM